MFSLRGAIVGFGDFLLREKYGIFYLKGSKNVFFFLWFWQYDKKDTIFFEVMPIKWTSQSRWTERGPADA